ncbi:MAG: PQQ-binding-like beta-propeller repeat protein [Verrucomicrobiales bacterium]|nr:PQQ-binding-like beta-propeller repeat protein [Verrucomicrobiales bacterium]
MAAPPWWWKRVGIPFLRSGAWMVCGLVFGVNLATSAADTDWPVYHGDPEGTHYSSLRQIHRRNVHRLQPAWIYRCGDARANSGSTIECNPLILGGRMYLTTPGLRVVEVDAATGEEGWRFDPWDGRSGGGVNRGLAYWEEAGDRRLFFAAGWKLYALDAGTGRPIPGFGTGGYIDLREGLDQDAFYLSVSAPTPGVVYRDLLIMGSSIPDSLPPTAPGHIRAFDVRTGARRWIFHTIPHPGESGHETWGPDNWQHNGGANAWGGVTLDPSTGVVYCGTGSANYDHYGGDRPGANLYANCILALDALTGVRRWHFQTVHHDVWDYDLPCAPVLVDVRRGWRRVPALVQSTKMGHLFVLDRRTGRPLFPVEERPVPASDIPGESVWPTQPFPVKPPPFARQGFRQDEATRLSEASRKDVEDRLKTMRSEGLFTPPSRVPTVVMPQFNGGGEWGGPAVDPKRGWVYVNGSNEPEWIQMLPARLPEGVTAHELGGHLFRATCSQCHGAGRPDLPRTAALQSLKDVAQRLSREAVLTLLETGRGQMPSFASMSVVERRAVVAFLFGDRGGAPVPAADLDQGWARRIPWVANGHPEFRDAEGFPANAPPWGTLTAVDLRRGEIVWQIPLGTYPELEKRGLPPTGTFNIGGPLVTAGGLVFIGAAMDERFRAVDARTGRVLWEQVLDAGGYATPATYEVDGRQYVVIAAGGGGKPGTRSGDGWWSFALP